MDIQTLKRAPVGYVNTPLEFMPNLTKEIGKGKLYIKRDDMTGLAMGGNKARKRIIWCSTRWITVTPP